MKACRMDCPYCGASIEADIENTKIIYCTYCGKQLQIEDDSNSISINQRISINQNINQRVINDAEILKERNRHKEKRLKLLIMFVLLVLFVGGIIALLFKRITFTSIETNPYAKNDNTVTTEKNEDSSVLQKEEKAKLENQSENNETEYHEESVTVNSQEGQELELIECGYSVRKGSSFIYIHYAVKIKNSNKALLAAMTRLYVTAKSADGRILSTEDDYIPCISPDETILYAGTVFYEGIYPDSVDFRLSYDDRDFYSPSVLEGAVRQDQFTISNVSVNNRSYSRSFTGEITNNSNKDLSSSGIVIVFRNEGKMVGGIRGYADRIKSGDTIPFDVNDDTGIEYDSYEIYGYFD